MRIQFYPRARLLKAKRIEWPSRIPFLAFSAARAHPWFVVSFTILYATILDYLVAVAAYPLFCIPTMVDATLASVSVVAAARPSVRDALRPAADALREWRSALWETAQECVLRCMLREMRVEGVGPNRDVGCYVNC